MLMAVAISSCAAASACTSVVAHRALGATSPPAASGTASTNDVPRSSSPRVSSSLAHWRLRTPISRANAFASGGRILLVGGLTRGDVSTSAVTAIDPRSGAQHRVGMLARPVHDAGGGTLGGRPYLFGGGSSVSTALVQRSGAGRATVAGRLPAARSDLAAVRVGGAVYLVGGYDGQHWSAAVLRTRDGRTFHSVARLPVPVRYPAVAAAAGAIWVFGGLTPAGPTDVVQRVDPASGRSAIVAHLPLRLTGASAFVLDGQVLICGGKSGGQARRAIYRLDDRSRTVIRAGKLARPASYAAAAVVSGAGYLLGGETSRPLRRVQVIRLRGARAPNGGNR